MFDILLHTLFASLPIYILFGLGVWLRSQKQIQAENEKAILHLTMDIAYPCLIFYNILNSAVIEGNENLSNLGFCFQAISCGFLEMAVGVSVAYLCAKALRLSIGDGLRTFVVSAGLQNYVFFAIPLLQILSLGENDPSLGILFIHNIGCEVFVWSFAVFLMSGDRSAMRLGVMMRGPLCAVLLSLLLVWTGLGQYIAIAPVMHSTQMIGAIATPVSLILCGCSIYDIFRHASWNIPLMGTGILARLLITPGLLLLLAALLPLDPLLKRMMIIQGAIPSAVISAMLAKRFHGKPELSMQVVLTTTLASLLSLPLWLYLGDRYITPIFSS